MCNKVNYAQVFKNKTKQKQKKTPKNNHPQSLQSCEKPVLLLPDFIVVVL